MEISKNNFEILILIEILHDVIFPWYCTQSQLVKMNVKKVDLPTLLEEKFIKKRKKKLLLEKSFSDPFHVGYKTIYKYYLNKLYDS